MPRPTQSRIQTLVRDMLAGQQFFDKLEPRITPGEVRELERIGFRLQWESAEPGHESEYGREFYPFDGQEFAHLARVLGIVEQEGEREPMTNPPTPPRAGGDDAGDEQRVTVPDRRAQFADTNAAPSTCPTCGREPRDTTRCPQCPREWDAAREPLRRPYGPNYEDV